MKPIAVLAIGGNSLEQPGRPASFAEQQRIARLACEGIVDVLRAGYRVVVTHGNGPQVGQALLRSELAASAVPPIPLDACGAETQGLIGYLLQQELTNVLRERGLWQSAVSLVTQVVVDENDPAFAQPSKPVGPFYSSQEAERRQRELGWVMVEDAGRGWRRVVPSPQPIELVEIGAVRTCLRAGHIVIAGGGGGIPVVRRQNRLQGVEAVVDKDRTSSLLARQLHAELLLFSTAVDRVALHFGRPEQRLLDRLSWEEARQYLQQGHFPPGSMGPKIEAALEFLAAGGQRVLITSPENIIRAVRGQAGTEILQPLRAAQPRWSAA